MSAYGKLAAPKRAGDVKLSARVYALPKRVRDNPSESRAAVLFVPFGLSGAEELPPSARALLHDVFNTELERGLTYPQLGPLAAEDFDGYFLAYDLLVGIFLPALPSGVEATEVGTDVAVADALGEGKTLADLDWKDTLACFYYVKPNYPGRSSHLCNGGFVVPEWNRGLGLGGLAGRSFLHYAPAIGYRGSVFNLVYENNAASLAIWQRLGFTLVGKIPGAGLLKRAGAAPGEPQEEYVDAWVIFCNFEERAQKEAAARKEIA